MIGGKDIIYPRRLSSDMLGFTLRTIEEHWPQGWVWLDGEYTNYAKMTIHDAVRNTVGSFGELLIYADISAWTSWDRDGANEENGDKLLHILLGEDSTTFVVHHEAGVTQAMVAAITSGLNRHYPLLTKAPDTDLWAEMACEEIWQQWRAAGRHTNQLIDPQKFFDLVAAKMKSQLKAAKEKP